MTFGKSLPLWGLSVLISVLRTLLSPLLVSSLKGTHHPGISATSPILDRVCARGGREKARKRLRLCLWVLPSASGERGQQGGENEFSRDLYYTSKEPEPLKEESQWATLGLEQPEALSRWNLFGNQ